MKQRPKQSERNQIHTNLEYGLAKKTEGKVQGKQEANKVTRLSY